MLPYLSDNVLVELLEDGDRVLVVRLGKVLGNLLQRLRRVVNLLMREIIDNWMVTVAQSIDYSMTTVSVDYGSDNHKINRRVVTIVQSINRLR